MSPLSPPHRPALGLLLLLAACGPAEPDAAPRSAPAPAQAEALAPWGGLVDEAAARGLDYVNLSGQAHKPTVLEANGAGVALIDLGSDGDLDLVFAQGLAGCDALVRGPGADLEVFENDGSGHFTRRPGPGLSGWWIALAVGDLDDDGDQDLVAGGLGCLQVLLADDSGQLVPAGASLLGNAQERFEPGAARQAGAAPLWVNALALFDADRDGKLDLYVGNYLDFDPRAPQLGALGEGPLAVPCRWKGQDVFCGPRGLTAQPDRLLRGRGDGSFEERSRAWLGEQPAGYTLAVLPFDFDADGDADLYVACDSAPNQLFVNDGSGRFTDVGYSAGVALSADGAAEAGMGAAAGDVDRDGWLDLAVTNFSGEPTALYLGSARGFRNETFRAGLYRETRDLLSWGVHLVDLDGDGWLELFTANGHVYPQADAPDTGTRYGQAASLWRLGPEVRAERIAAADERSLLYPELGARGSAVGDLDGDGDPDLVLARIDGPAALGINRSSANWLALRCLGPEPGGAPDAAGEHRTPPDGSGARVVLRALGEQARAQLGEVQTAVGYASASSAWLHFGLAGASEYAELEVHWPSGRVERLGPGRAGRRLWVREGQGVVREEPLR